MNRTFIYKSFRALIVLMLWIQWSCVDEVSLDISSQDQRIIVDGMIGNDFREYRINVKESAILGRGAEFVNFPVLGASVTVLDDMGNSYEFLEKKDGEFYLEMAGIEGRSYHVEVILAEGRTIISKPITLLSAPPIDSVEVEVYPKQIITESGIVLTDLTARLLMNTSWPSSSNPLFLRWKIDGMYEFNEEKQPPARNQICYVNDRIDNNNLSIINTEDVDGLVIRDEEFFEMPYDQRFAYNYRFKVDQLSLSREEHEYWRTVQDIIDVDGSLFDPPPGVVRGNLNYTDDENDLVLGYFSVSGISGVEVFASASSTGTFAEPFCQPFRPQGRSEACDDCRTLRNSITEKPPGWP